MYVLKMSDDKSLITTIRSTLYQHENEVDTLVFLLPQYYETLNLADCDVQLFYTLPNGNEIDEELVLEPEPYNQEYYRYHTKITTEITSLPGRVSLYLKILSEQGDRLMSSGRALLTIHSSEGFNDGSSDDPGGSQLSGSVIYF